MRIPKALERLTDAVRVRHFSHATEKAYTMWLRSYMEAVQDFPPEWSSEQKVERFLTDEAQRGVAASTQTQAFNALAFFYRAVLETPLQGVEALRARRPATVRLALYPFTGCEPLLPCGTARAIGIVGCPWPIRPMMLRSECEPQFPPTPRLRPHGRRIPRHGVACRL